MTLRKIFEAVTGNKEKNEDHKRLIAAIRSQKPNTVLGILQDGADPNYKGGLLGRTGGNPLRVCMAEGTPEIFKILLDHGADPNEPVMSGKMGAVDSFSLLYRAIDDGKEDYASILLDQPGINIAYGGLTTVASVYGAAGSVTWPTPLEMAQKKGMTDIVEKIRARQANDNRKAKVQPGRNV